MPDNDFIKRFLGDVSEHQMTIIRDDGVNRHVRFRKPGTYCMSFDLITWPGSLCYTGDMGTYAFCRLEDMFEFFRTDRLHARPGQTLVINPSYWGEKLVAADSADGYRNWSREKFAARLRETFDDWLNDNEINGTRRSELLERLQDELIAYLDEEGKEGAYRAARDFEIDKSFPFESFWEVDTDDYSYRFLWCCYALAWGIAVYDQAKRA